MAPSNLTKNTIKKAIKQTFKKASSKYWDLAPKKPVSEYKYYQEPVPGLYTCEPERNTRHLVYIKNNHGDFEHIFKEPEAIKQTPEGLGKQFWDLEGTNSEFSCLKSRCKSNFLPFSWSAMCVI